MRTAGRLPLQQHVHTPAVETKSAASPSRTLALSPNSIEGLLHEIFLIHVLWWVPNTSYNPPNWSVAVEIYAYLIFALACFFHRRILLAGMFLIAVPSAFAILNVGVLNDAHLLAVPRGFLGFSVGIFVHALWIHFGARSNLPILGDLALVGMFSYVYFGGSLVFQPALVFGVMLLGLISGADKILLAPFVRADFSLWLGKLSYTLYMVHFFVAMRFEEVAQVFGGGLIAEITYLIFYCITSLFLSSVVFKYFEWPARKLLRGKSL